jgi:predicted nucleic-acid-binding protein
MKSYVIDTNALLSFVTDRNPGQQAVMAGIFNQVAATQAEVICPQNVLAEFVYVMETVYHQPKSKIRSILSDFLATPGIHIEDKVDFSTVFSFWPEALNDYGDAIVAACALAIRGAIVVTFDRSFLRKLRSCRISFHETHTK